MHSDIPTQVKESLASPEMRWKHHYWHLVKNPGFANSPSPLRDALRNVGWQAPQLTDEPGAGIDFLDMHRQMIGRVNMMLVQAADPDWPAVEGWTDIPADNTDPDWPVPDIPGSSTDPWSWEQLQSVAGIGSSRDPQRITQMMDFASTVRDPNVLTIPAVSIDVLGSAIEGQIHNWMHMFFAMTPPVDTRSMDIQNDWLGQPFSSHVNPYFWKLHGWIDDCITAWEDARGENADFSGAWQPPADAPPPDALVPGLAAGTGVDMGFEHTLFRINKNMDDTLSLLQP